MNENLYSGVSRYSCHNVNIILFTVKYKKIAVGLGSEGFLHVYIIWK